MEDIYKSLHRFRGWKFALKYPIVGQFNSYYGLSV